MFNMLQFLQELKYISKFQYCYSVVLAWFFTRENIYLHWFVSNLAIRFLLGTEQTSAIFWSKKTDHDNNETEK